MTEPAGDPGVPVYPDELAVGDVVEVRVDAVAHGGHCVARYGGRVVFVRLGLPGEQVRVRLTEVRPASFCRGEVVEVLVPHPDRVEAPCVHFRPGGCGGCDFQHAAGPLQRELKGAVVAEQLRRLAGLDVAVTVQALPDAILETGPDAAPDTGPDTAQGGVAPGFGWRTRVRWALDADGRIGPRAVRSHRVVPVSRDRPCLIAAPGFSEAAAVLDVPPGVRDAPVRPGPDDRQAVAGPGGAAGVPETEEDDRGAGGRPEQDRGTGGRPEQDRPTGGGPARDRRRRPDRRSERGRGGDRGRGTVRGRAADRGRRRSALPEVILVQAPDGEVRSAWPGEDARLVVEQAAGRDWQVAGDGFWQVHPAAPQVLADAVRAALGDADIRSAWDLYGGVGLFAAVLADVVGPGGSVVSVEGDRHAAELAAANLADLPGVRTVRGAVADVVADLPDRVDAVVLDPPRTGAGPALCREMALREPAVLVYVACDPAALGRDAAALAGAGYRLDGLAAFDCFPQTHHVECVARFVPAG
ncbi:class I SAM-dependent RNA methyltransferase [Nakamurella endophytica]|uniref:TRAM domain-containing protein n=1 Tax=Nakamurella endophytica TaxID=1748367 RepID=A0A917T6J1_9ACTN|nr:TRAM domain-containing protein [Nakamurella endophytica]GGM12093.1 hypothetical protein GCM10011594_34920 [Nakamurella endophytica]